MFCIIPYIAITNNCMKTWDRRRRDYKHRDMHRNISVPKQRKHFQQPILYRISALNPQSSIFEKYSICRLHITLSHPLTHDELGFLSSFYSFSAPSPLGPMNSKLHHFVWTGCLRSSQLQFLLNPLSYRSEESEPWSRATPVTTALAMTSSPWNLGPLCHALAGNLTALKTS